MTITKTRSGTRVSDEDTKTPLPAATGFKFGADPELFVLDKRGKPVSPDMIPGTKNEPHRVKCGAVQRDGMAAEFNIDPAETFEEFNSNVGTVLGELKTFLPKGYTLSAVPSVTFTAADFDAAPDEAKELGCQPDYDAWTGEVNPPPHDPENPYLRTASGHLHIGWGDDYELSDIQHIMNCQDLVKQFDWYLGTYSVSQDEDATRRRLYGKAGAFRPKPYGVEYRVLSNFWITTKERRLAVWNRMQIAIADMRRRYIPDLVPPSANSQICTYINETKRDAALEQAWRYPMVTTDPSFSRV